MKHRLRYIVPILFLLAILAGCASVPHNSLMQVSTIGALLDGDYAGHMTCRELLESGDFGLGTFEKLDGEMVVLDGVVYQIKADGRVYRPDKDVTTPFAVVTPFQTDRVIGLSKTTDYAGIQKIIDNESPDKGIFLAVKITGRFPFMKTRSVPAQVQPYPRLVEVVKHQSIFELKDVSGTVVGFRSPPYVKGGINVPGYHLHFLSDDKTAGGHILEFEITEGTIELDYCNRFTMVIPEGALVEGRPGSSGMRGSDELERVEK